MFNHITAQTARDLVDKAKKDKINYQRDYVMRAIKCKASTGDRQLVIDFEHVILFEADWQYFKDLGYTVKMPEKYTDDNGVYWSNFGIISW